ncbi:MAG: homoserine O-succinyltransferase MetX [Pseudomonadota bacterium]
MSLAPVSCIDPPPAGPCLDDAHPPAARRAEFDLDLPLRHAGRRRLRLRYEDVGDVRAPAVLVAGGISAHRHLAAHAADAAPGWWDAQVGAGRVLDPADWRLLSIDWLGADGSLDAPIDPADQAAAIAALLDHLGIGVLRAFVGSSYGAMVGLQLAAAVPARLARLVAISGTHRAHPYASAWRALQRRAVALGALQCDDVDGLVLARQLALLSYRTPEEFGERFGPARVVEGRVRVAAEDYLDHCGNAYAQRTPPAAFLRLSESIDLQDVDPARIAIPVTLVAVEQDRLVPLPEVYALAQQLRGETRLRVLRSRYGHDAFLKEPEAIAAVLAEALDAGVRA